MGASAKRYSFLTSPASRFIGNVLLTDSPPPLILMRTSVTTVTVWLLAMRTSTTVPFLAHHPRRCRNDVDQVEIDEREIVRGHRPAVLEAHAKGNRRGFAARSAGDDMQVLCRLVDVATDGHRTNVEVELESLPVGMRTDVDLGVVPR